MVRLSFDNERKQEAADDLNYWSGTIGLDTESVTVQPAETLPPDASRQIERGAIVRLLSVLAGSPVANR